jgi:hypothetical protein
VLLQQANLHFGTSLSLQHVFASLRLAAEGVLTRDAATNSFASEALQALNR